MSRWVVEAFLFGAISFRLFTIHRKNQRDIAKKMASLSVGEREKSTVGWVFSNANEKGIFGIGG